MDASRLESVLNRMKMPPPQQTIKQRIEHWMEGDDGDIVFLELKENAAILEKYNNFRWQSQGWINKQDRALRDFRNFMVLFCMTMKRVEGIHVFKDGEVTDVNDHLIFSHDPMALTSTICQFLIFTAKNLTRRKKPRIGTLFAIRAHMWFWITKSHLHPTPNPPTYPYFYRRTTEVIRGLNKDGVFSKESKKKTYLGLPELVQLIEYDLLHTKCIDVAEQHAVAWLFGYLCGIRPGSLAPTPVKDGPLLWGDIEINRELDPEGNWDGRFSVDVTFRNMKTPTKEQEADETRTMRVTVGSPTRRVILSLPHRLLTILIRRGYLKRHASVESLMQSREYSIAIKEEAKKLPVFLAGSARGLGLTDSAAKALSFTEYIKLRVMWLGYDGDSSFYSWRRKFGTQIDRKLGPEKTRIAMNHCPMSRVYEAFYDQGLFDMNVTAMLIDGTDGADKRVAENHNSLALHRAELVRQCEEREKVLNKIVADNVEVQQAIQKGDATAVKNIKKKVRKYALAALLSEERDLQKESRTTDDIKNRIAELKKPGAFAKMVKAKAADLERRAQNQLLDIEEDIELAQDFRDLEDELAELDGSIGPVQTIRREFHEGDTDDLDVATVTSYTVFMELLLSFVPEKQDLSCSLCAENPFRTEEEKTFRYKYIGGLRQHKAGQDHTPYGEFKARALYYAKQCQGESHTFHCTYGCGKKFKNFGRLRDHIRFDNPFDFEREHDELKTKDGWYETGFFPRNMIDGSLLNRNTSKRARRIDEEEFDVTIFDRPRKIITQQVEGYTHPLLVGKEDLLVKPGKTEDLIAYHFEWLYTDGDHSAYDLFKGKEDMLHNPEDGEIDYLKGRELFFY